MIVDRTTKVLLTLIAVALWGILIRITFAPAPTQAQAPIYQPVRITGTDLALPVTIVDQRKPVEIRTPDRVSIPVEIAGQRGRLQIQSP